MDLSVLKSRPGTGVLIVALGGLGAVATARFAPANEHDDATRALSPIVASARPLTPPVRIAAGCPRRDAPDYYYPWGLFGSAGRDGQWSAGDDEELRRRYGGFLRVMAEPSLSCGTEVADESYRALLVPAGIHLGESVFDPIGVRIERTGSRVRLHATVLGFRTRATRSEPEHRTCGAGARPITSANMTALRSLDTDLDERYWDEVLARLDAARFWNSPAIIPTDPTTRPQWLIEGRRGDAYWVVSRDALDDPAGSRSGYDAAFTRVGVALLELANLRELAADIP